MNVRSSKSVCLAIALAAFALAGCGSSSANSTSSNGPGSSGAKALKSIAWGDVTTAQPVYKAIGDQAVAIAKQHGIKATRYDNNLDGATELTNARLMVQAKPDVIIDWLGDASAVPAVSKVFKASGIPCVAVVLAIPGCKTYNYQHSDQGVLVGKAVAAEAHARDWTATDTHIVVAWTPKYGEENLNLYRYFYSTFAASFPGMDQVKPDDIPLSGGAVGKHAVFVDGGGLLDTTNRVVSQTLQNIPRGDDVIVFAATDEGGLGAKQALIAGGFSSKQSMIVTTGFGATGLSELRKQDSYWAAGALAFLNVMPKYTLSIAQAIRAGDAAPEVTQLPIAVVTKDSVNQYFTASGEQTAPPLPAADAYLKPYLDALGGPLPPS